MPDWKQSFTFSLENAFFQSGTSLPFQALVVRYGYNHKWFCCQYPLINYLAGSERIDEDEEVFTTNSPGDNLKNTKIPNHRKKVERRSSLAALRRDSCKLSWIYLIWPIYMLICILSERLSEVNTFLIASQSGPFSVSFVKFDTFYELFW